MPKINLSVIENPLFTTGKQISFIAPCKSAETECLVINGVNYSIVDSDGLSVAGIENVWNTGALVSVILNVETHTAFIQNANTNPYLEERLRSSIIEPGEGVSSIQHKDTEAKAPGDTSVAFNNAVAGAMGYRYKAIDLSSHWIFLTKGDITYDETDPDNVLGNIRFTDTGFNIDDLTELEEPMQLPYEVGDIFTLKTRSTDYDNIGVITGINGNMITFAQGTALDTLTEDIVREEDRRVDRYSFHVPAKSHLGHVPVSANAAAFGTSETRASGSYSFAAGGDTKAYGDGAATFGKYTEAGYNAIASGNASKSKGQYTATFGYTCINEGDESLAVGHNTRTKPDAKYSVVGGYQNSVNHVGGTMFGRLNNGTTYPDQTIIGRGATPHLLDGNPLFVVGNGIIDYDEDGAPYVKQSSNAFRVFEDGRASIGKAPTKDMDVVNRGSLSSLVPPIAQSSTSLKKGTGTLSVQLNESSPTASGTRSIALGQQAKALGNDSIALGPLAEAQKEGGIAFGYLSKSMGKYTFTFGLGLKTPKPTAECENREQTVVGRYNAELPGISASGGKEDTAAVFIVGNGTSDTTRSNSIVVWGDGRVTVSNNTSYTTKQVRNIAMRTSEDSTGLTNGDVLHVYK